MKFLVALLIYFLSLGFVYAAGTVGLSQYQGLVSENLLGLRDFEIENLNSDQVQKMNKKTLNQIRQLPKESKKKISYITREMAQKMVQSVMDHPVVGDSAQSRYEQKSTNIGYCFGRATYVHWLSQMLGINKNSIKKAWVVGPMVEGPDKYWSYHVATIIRGEDHNWWAIDRDTGKLMTLDEWNEFWQKTSEDGKLRLYITDPEKFTAPLSEYSHIELGTHLKRKEDWYKGYFKDLLKWFQSNPDLEALGLPEGKPHFSCRKLVTGN